MRGLVTIVVLAAVFVVTANGALESATAENAQATSAGHPESAVALHDHRLSPSDLEVGGDLTGLSPGTTRYVTYNTLLTLPQVTYTVKDDSNFTGPTEVSGVPLENLGRLLGASPASDLVVAICDDKYRTNYPPAYLAAHHPLLVLKINGQPPERWPKDAEGHGQDMGPYMISHPSFTPSFKILAHEDEPQIPWGVVRFEFRNEKTVFGAIAPRGKTASDLAVQAGYRIAQQNCFRCHNQGTEGGEKAGHPWLVLSAWANASPEYFSAYVRNPQLKNPHAQMPGNPRYDDPTLHALTDYFRTFTSRENP
jgi:mono/diheme cytochrome c family protein